MASMLSRRMFASCINATLLLTEKCASINSRSVLRNLRTVNADRNVSQPRANLVSDEGKEEERQRVNSFFDRVNEQIEERKNDRHFAVIHMYSQQHLVKEGDIFIARKDVPAAVGDKVKIEKVLLIGNENLTLIGRPLLNRDLAHVEATVVEKTMTHTYTSSRKFKKQSGYRRWTFKRLPLTMLRINEVKICHKLNESQSIIQ
ncbi:39S ribosomal protein L21-like protein [Leptotrombidium deliense]|uniref:Large ribosomal subunit protein bL21m n=1 Tax=Leptotrombidium deliense TaxID=299467 RepID=A0A443RTT8_9ACAR|nr:39S ribosomal protein L21-like protein [Leptotrombidium deliense]